ncbi:MAG TPA: DUF3099 domain-containing protein [Jiangellaceae bacterium]|nr:DUF3099 domain-containing protein [Jiangellaceae bacterium]
MRVRRRRSTATQSVTTAAAPRSDDLAVRQRNYLIMMALRVVCLLMVLPTEGWVRWACMLGAVVLPYIAVVVANAVSRPQSGSLQTPSRDPQAVLRAGADENGPR